MGAREIIRQIMGSTVLPPIPPYPRSEKDGVQAVRREELEASALTGGINQVVPLSLRMSGGDWWQVPIEPQVSITGSAVIAKRKVAKGHTMRGTVKEYWALDDYAIQISGVLYGKDRQYPRDEVSRLRSFCEADEAIEVICPILEVFGIDRIVIESFAFPFTKGEDIQAYEINAVSDVEYELLEVRS
jgi:hypothetical protein